MSLQFEGQKVESKVKIVVDLKRGVLAVSLVKFWDQIGVAPSKVGSLFLSTERPASITQTHVA
jgi:hypothetical protein